MKYIAYVSQAVAPFDTGALATLLARSRDRNAAEGITGLLVYRYDHDLDRGSFLQVLEGPERALDDVWRRIANDARHHTVVVVEAGETADRMFANWSMGFRNVDASDLAGSEGFADLGSDAFWDRARKAAPSGALDLLKGFYDGP